jgi:hypothetical protein
MLSVYADSARSAACLSAQRTRLLSGLAGRPNAKIAVAAPKVKYLKERRKENSLQNRVSDN